MRLESLYVNGFGIFHEFPITGLSEPPLTVIYGPNESGKTTLLAFIRHVFFGFPDSRSKEKQFSPLRGGKHGGHIVLLQDSTDKYVVERYQGPKGGIVRVTLPDGSEGGVQELEALLGHASKDLFKNLFAFGLSELEQFESLGDKQIQARIYSAGTGTGKISVPKVGEQLAKEASELFTERASKPKLNKLFKEVGDIHSQLSQIGDSTKNYDQLCRKLEQVNATITRLKQKSKELQKGLGHVKDMLRAWDDWRDLRNGENRLRELPVIVSFPEGGIVRMDTNLEKLSELKEALDGKGKECEAPESELESILLDGVILAHAEDVKSLFHGRGKYDSARSDLPKREIELKEAKDDLQKTLRNLGSGWDEQRLEASDTSIPVREEIRQHKGKLSSAQQRVHDAELDLARTEKQVADAVESLKEVKELCETLSEPQEKDSNLLQSGKGVVRKLRALFPSHRACFVNLQHGEERLKDLQDRLETVRDQLSRKTQPLPSWPAISLIAMIVGIAIWLLVQSQVLLMVIVAVVLGCMLASYIYFRRHQVQQLQDSEDRLRGEMEQLKLRVAETQKVKEEANKQIEENKEILKEGAEQLGVGEKLDEATLETADAKIDGFLEALLQWDQADKDLKKSRNNLEKTKLLRKTLSEALDKEKKEQKVITTAWQEWLKQYELSLALTPDGALEMFLTIERCREKLKGVQELHRRCEEIRESVEKYEEEARRVLRSCGREIRPREQILSVVDKLAKDLETAKKNKNRIEELKRDIKRLKGEGKVLSNQIEIKEKELSDLMEKGSASNEEEFRINDKIAKERESLEATIRQKRGSVEHIAGAGEAFKNFTEELMESNPEDLRSEELELDDKISDLEEKFGTEREGAGSLRQQISNLKKTEETSKLRLKENIVKERIETLARGWGVLTIARVLLQEAREKYERERQPAVIQEAQSFFYRMTLGRYQKVVSPLGESQVEILARDNSRKGLNDLSRATAEQLYLSLRFGLVREFGRRAQSLPVIVDDILVNFDPERLKAACEALRELSEAHQVLILTCHPETRKLIEKVITDARVIDLQN